MDLQLYSTRLDAVPYGEATSNPAAFVQGIHGSFDSLESSVEFMWPAFHDEPEVYVVALGPESERGSVEQALGPNVTFVGLLSGGSLEKVCEIAPGGVQARCSQCGQRPPKHLLGCAWGR